jgi:hypothetical protein
MDLLDSATKVLQDRLSKNPAFGQVALEVRTDTRHSTADDKRMTDLIFTARNPNIEVHHGQFEDMVRNALYTDAFKPHVKFESDTDHMKRLANELRAFINLEAEMNAKTTGERTISIPDNYPKWFEEIGKRNEFSSKNAFVISKDQGIITMDASVPKDVDPAVIAASFEARKGAILEMLADRVVKYTPSADTDEKKAALKAQVKALEVFVETSDTYSKRVTIRIMSKDQLAATKDADGKPQAIPAEKVAELAATNPLNALKNGEKELDKDNPPHLQKALARSFLFAGDKANEIFPLIAGKDDMRRAVIKTLIKLKNTRMAENPNSQIGKAVDNFLNDDVFKEVDRWGTPANERQDFKQPILFTKDAGRGHHANDIKYEKGKMEFTVSVPTNKLPQILELVATNKDIPAPVQATPPQPTATVQQATPTTNTPPATVQQQPAQAQATPPLKIYQPPVEQAEQQQQPQAAGDVYKGIARDIIKLHKARNPQGWQAQMDQKAQEPTPNGTGRGAA